MMKRGVFAAATMILLGAMGRADAAGIIDFNMDAIHPNTASVSYAGGLNPLIGSNLSVDSLTGLDTPSHDGSTLLLTNGRLNFTTGDLISADSGHWYFGPG